MLNIKVWIQK